MPDAFRILDPKRRDASQRKAFDAQEIPSALGSHKAAAAHFQPHEELVLAINAALAVGAPLLLTGEPGTGKTQVAYWIAWHFEIQDRLFPFHVRSTTVASDLLYRFDTVGYFHAAHDPNLKGGSIDRGAFIQKGVLWKALVAEGRAIVLIDEIDKAHRDFPNDLLNVLDQHRFTVIETGEEPARREGAPPPLVVITSNSERRLPEPFLRRCIFHHIEFTPELVRRAVAARTGDFPRLDAAAQEAALERFLELRDRDLRKKPATSELLVWLTLLSARGGVSASDLRRAPLRALPALSALIKDRDDWAQL
ncbi:MULTISPECIES: AAA family ATPase [unclassified Sorangium]|uniref:AAA family ATPase n=1 Tax=unclassified Sorangium TaxID=2621164 RepID=UPI003F5FF04A